MGAAVALPVASLIDDAVDIPCMSLPSVPCSCLHGRQCPCLLVSLVFSPVFSASSFAELVLCLVVAVLVAWHFVPGPDLACSALMPGIVVVPLGGIICDLHFAISEPVPVANSFLTLLDYLLWRFLVVGPSSRAGKLRGEKKLCTDSIASGHGAAI